jgi:ABC-type lipoprotein release transport system permease subunit
MGLVRFGLRNLARHPGRLAVVVVLIAVPFLFVLLTRTIGAAVLEHTEALKRSVDTALQLRARGSMGHVNMVGSSDLLPQEVLDKVRQLEHVVKVEPYLLAMTPTEGHNFAMVVGVNPGDVKRLESHGEAGNPRIIAGRDLVPEDQGKDVGVIGQGLARWGGVTTENLDRATLTLDLRRTHPAIFALDRPARTLRIVGIHASGYVFGDMQLFIPLDTFRDAYGVRKGISWLFLRVDSVDHVAEVRRRLDGLVGGVADVIAPEHAAFFASTTTRAVLRLARWGTALAAGLMAIVVFFVMLLVVRERAWEIGTLKALGAPTGGIAVAYLTEAVAVCLIAALAGALLFALAGSVIAPRLFALGAGPFLAAHYRDTLFDALPLTAVGPTSLPGLLGLAAAVAVAGSAWGLVQVVRLSPLEAMRHE